MRLSAPFPSKEEALDDLISMNLIKLALFL